MQADIVQCKKKYDLSKKEVEKIAIEIQSKTGVAALENNTEQDETTETAEVHAGEVNAQEVNTEEEMVLQDILHFDVERFMERQEAKDYKWFRTISAYLLKRIDNTTPQVEVLAIREHAEKIILKRYKLTEEYSPGLHQC